MKIVVLYRPNSEFARASESFMHDLQQRYLDLAGVVEAVDYDSRDGVRTAGLYEVMTHPTVLLLRDDGSLAKGWAEGSLPAVEEVANHAFSLR